VWLVQMKNQLDEEAQAAEVSNKFVPFGVLHSTLTVPATRGGRGWNARILFEGQKHKGRLVQMQNEMMAEVQAEVAGTLYRPET
jgi:hypothetical protein